MVMVGLGGVSMAHVAALGTEDTHALGRPLDVSPAIVVVVWESGVGEGLMGQTTFSAGRPSSSEVTELSSLNGAELKS